jgi:hypothetical protein
LKVPLSIFSTFVAASPSAKLAAVTRLKQGRYDVRADWWKGLREAIPANHRNAGTKGDLSQFASSVTLRKVRSYTACALAYTDWWGDRNIRWTGGRPTPWMSGDVQVAVNPELFVAVDGIRHVIKLYFSATKLPVDRANTILRLLEVSYRSGESPSGRPIVAVLDLSQGRLLTPDAPLNYLDPVLAGEAASFAAIWNAV